MNTNRNRFLDILKGLAVLFITATHYDFTDWNRLDYFFPYWIDTAVPIFMLISGYVATLSYRKSQVETIEQAYEPSILVGKAVRYTIPFFIAYVVEIAYSVMAHGVQSFQGLGWLVHFVKGGNGPGAFYYPLLIQLILVFPLIYFLIQRLGFFGVVLSFLATYAMEIMKGVYQMPENTYCLLLFRYTFIIAVGVYLASERYKTHLVWQIGALVAGFVFIYGMVYRGWDVPFIDYWEQTSLLGCLYIAPIVGFGIRHCSNWHFPPLEFLGKASYYIFLTQKVYYIYGRKIYMKIPGERYDFLVTMVICITVGILFYLAVEPLNKKACQACKEFCRRHPIPDAWR
ncbi:MAG: acyltransferase [Lachnospiraceae bacterium]|nr:acyltransferase [Lachnospiraceae bacterium]